MIKTSAIVSEAAAKVGQWRPLWSRRCAITSLVLMLISHKVGRSTLLATILTSLLIGCALHSGEGIKVRIENNTSITLTNVELVFTGGIVTTSAITPGERKVFDVKPTGESHLVLRFVGPTGQKQETTVNVYFENGSSGTITLAIDNGGVVNWKDEVRVR